MSYNLKTLVVFDTNSLRSTEAGDVAYSFFAFGKPFQLIEQFVTDNKLVEQVDLAVPDWAITELKDQKQRKYHADVEEYKVLAQRLSGLPHTGEIKFPEVEFDCIDYIEQKATEFISTKKLIRLELKEAIANTVLKSMMARVIKDEGKKAPFANLGKTYKDAGFKDNLVWENLMNFDGIADYNKIIFLTKDGDFNKHCVDEFSVKWAKHITILKDENNVIYELNKDYEEHIKFRSVIAFANSDIFKDILKKQLDDVTLIMVDEVEQPIVSYEINDYCDKVTENIPQNDDEALTFSFIVKSTFVYKWDEETKNTEVEIVVAISEANEVLNIEYSHALLT